MRLLVHNQSVMRRLTILPACLAVLLAFFMAPYQHVHLSAGHEADGDHDDSTIVHVHFYAISIPTAEDPGNSVDAKHKDHVSSSLDTFTSVPQTALLLAYQAEPATTVFVPDKSFAPAEFVQAQGHDPPCVESSVPRAPPA